MTTLSNIKCIEIALNHKHPDVQACMDDCNRMHTTVQALFSCAREHGDVLYRALDGNLLIRTDRHLKLDSLPPGFRLLRIRPLQLPDQGQWVPFRLACAPSSCGARDHKPHFLRKAADRDAWLLRRMEQAGCQLRALDEQGLFPVRGRRGNRRIAFTGASYTGMLEVLDLTRLAEALRTGIGRGKAYGLGMLILEEAVP